MDAVFILFSVVINDFMAAAWSLPGALTNLAILLRLHSVYTGALDGQVAMEIAQVFTISKLCLPEFTNCL